MTDKSDPYRTRLLLLLCAAPQAVAVYFCVVIPRLAPEVIFGRDYFPEGKPLPAISRWVIDVSGANRLDDGSWTIPFYHNFALGVAWTWFAAVFCILWWQRDRLGMTRRWIVTTSTVWSLIAGWFLLVLVATALPMIPIIAEMKMAVPMTGAEIAQNLAPYIWGLVLFAICVGVFRMDARGDASD